MKAFSLENNFTDLVPDNVYWESLIAIWNIIYAERQPVTSVNAIRVSHTMTLKTLRTLSKCVLDVNESSIPVVEKNEEKKTLLLLLRKMLPEICSRGHNFHVELESVAVSIKSNTITATLRGYDIR